MKKLFCAVLSIVIVMLSVTSLAESIDLSTYSDDELCELLDRVQAELVNRGVGRSAELLHGKYYVGKDIPAGQYDVFYEYEEGEGFYLYVYYDEESNDIKYIETISDWGHESSGPRSLHVSLDEGNILTCSDKITLTISPGVVFR